jgi:hypothetical protein
LPEVRERIAILPDIIKAISAFLDLVWLDDAQFISDNQGKMIVTQGWVEVKC